MKKILLAASLLVLGALFFIFDLGQYLSLESIQSHKELLQGFYRKDPALSIGVYFLIYLAITGASLPGAAILTLLAGFLFGTLLGTLIVSFASSLGASLSFLFSRYLFQDIVTKKFTSHVQKINSEFKKNGLFYLFTLRLIPVIPFFVINIAMGLTKISVRDFYWVSQVGMLTGTVVYVNAGTQLGELTSLRGILSPTLIASFILLGAFPWVTKGILKALKLKSIQN